MFLDIAGLRIQIIDNDDRMVLHINQGEGYEEESLRMWAQLIKPGMVALDVGAYTGLFSVVAALRGAEVIAFEPMPANHWRADINCKLNKVKITLMSCAVSDRNGTAVLNYNAKVPLTTGASLETGNAAHGAHLVVPTIMIDSLALFDVCAIKLDVERHEVAVLRGAVLTIQRCRPPVLAETLDSDAREQILAMLPDYAVAAILDKRNTLFLPRNS